jgi:alkylation response protein AidB-like acyl-CoA dehydrogenase
MALAQILAWAQLRNQADLGDRDGAHDAMARARRELDADPHGEDHSRFGFDLAELELFTAEAHLALDEHHLAGVHAQAAIGHTQPGRSARAAASVILAASEVGQRRADQAIDLANGVLDEMPPASLREPDRRRLQHLGALLRAQSSPPAGSDELHDRLVGLVGLAPLAHPTERSPEPNGP